MNLTDEKIKKLELTANKIRQSIILMLEEAGSGHPAGSLGITDVMTLLYFHVLKHEARNPNWKSRDRLILSHGHVCPALYSAMAHVGYFPVEELKTLRKFGSRLQGHPHREFFPMAETSSGPLGEGLSQAIGMALADRIDHGIHIDKYFYCLVSDGELQEGQNWEALMLGGKEKLGNLIVIVDRNNIQTDGSTEDVMPLNSLIDKFEAFNWHVQAVDGHNFEMINDAIGKAKSVADKSSIIIAHTIPGKGVKDFEFDYHWHSVAPNKEQAKKAIKELKAEELKIKNEE